MSEFLDRFQARGGAIKAAYTAEDKRPNRPMKPNLIVDVMADLCLRAKAAGLNPKDCLHQAQMMADYEWAFVGEEIEAALPVRNAAPVPNPKLVELGERMADAVREERAS